MQLVKSTGNKDGVLTLKVYKDILNTNVNQIGPALEEALECFSDDKTEKCIYDLATSNIIDSVGLNMLINVVKKTLGIPLAVEIIISSPSVKRVVEFSGIDQIVPVRFKKKRRRR